VVAEEATSLDSSCARGLAAVAGRDEKRAFRSNKKLTKEERGRAALLKLLDNKSPIQGVQSLL
jgi:hypothetical protein